MDNAFFRAMGRLADLILLNLIFILCCLPVFTIGASLTAMYYVTLKMAANEEGYVFRSFWKSFRQNFKQATAIWIIMLFFGGVLVLDLLILRNMGGSFGTVFSIIISALAVLYLMVLIYVFPVLSRFENKVTTTLRNAFIMAIADFPRTFVMMALLIAVLVISLWNAYVFWYALLAWFLFGFAAVAFANSYLFHKIFKKYIPEEESEEAMEETAGGEVMEGAANEEK